VYNIHPDGHVEVEMEVVPQGAMPEMLPRMGWQFLLPKSFTYLTWYGRGPFETYPDRKSGAKAGIYHSTADREYVPYLIPQDYGNHTDVRYLRIGDEAGNGWWIRSDNRFQFSYHTYGTENLSRAMYTCQLKKAPYHTLNLDAEVSGVGGTAIRQLARYRVRPQRTVFTFEIIPY
jgi:beta-galactosidase